MIIAMESPRNAKSVKAHVLDRERQIREAAQAALRSSGYRAVATLECDVFAGTVVLSGTVSSFYYKQIAQTVVLRLPAVRRIENLVEVRHE